MWVPEKKLFRHGWVEGMQDHPAFHWGRANGWALLTMTEVLDVMPENYPQRAKLMELFREHVRGLAACQSGEGLWHQLLDRNDSLKLSTLNFVNNDSVRPYTVRLHSRLYRQLVRE